MSRELQDFKDALLARNVLARVIASEEHESMEHPSEESLKKYLHEHPGADPANHTVKQHGESSKGGEGSGEASKASARAKETTKHFEEMKALKNKVDNADSSAEKKFDRAYTKLYENGESAAKSAEKLIKKFEGAQKPKGVQGEQIEASVRLLQQAVSEWNQNKLDHHKSTNSFAHTKLQQAQQTWGYAKQIDDRIEMLDAAVRGEFE